MGFFAEPMGFVEFRIRQWPRGASLNTKLSVKGVASPAKPSARGNFVIAEVAPSSLEPLDAGSLFRAGVDSLTAGRMRGWALRLDKPDEAVRLTLSLAGIAFGEIETGLPRSDLEQEFPGNVAGFEFALTQWGLEQPLAALNKLRAMDGAELAAPAEINLVFADQSSRIDLSALALSNRALRDQLGSALAASFEKSSAPAAPRRASAQPAPDLVHAAAADLDDLSSGARFRLAVDSFRDGVLKGWAVDLIQPGSPLRVMAAVDGVELDRTMTSDHRPDLAGPLPKNVAGYVFDLRSWPNDRLQSLERRITASGRPASAPCRLILALGDGSVSIGLDAFGLTDGDLAGQIAKILGERRAEAAKAAAAQSARNLPGVVAAGAPAAVSAAPDQKQMVVLARMLAEERRQILGALGQASGDGQVLRAGARQLDLSMRRWRTLAMTEEIRGLAMLSDRVKRHALAIADLFDADFYQTSYDDRVSEIDNPLLHYVLLGWRLGLRPHPLLDVMFYRRQMGAAQGDPLLHYIREGAAAGLDPYPLFDTDFYRAHFMGDAEGAVNPLLHYLTVGGAARFDPSPFFKTAAFLASVSDADSVLCPLEHFVTHRKLHDFPVLAAFDPRLYRYQLEIERGEVLIDPPIAHYLGHGWRDEAILPNLFLDPGFYRTRNEIDLREPALVDYLREGDAAGFACHPFFSAKVYNEARGGDDDGASAIEHAMKSPATMLRSDQRMATAFDPRLLAFIDDLVTRDDDFDVDFYRRVNRDLNDLGDRELEAHWRKHGEAEGRIGSPRGLMRRAGRRIRDIPLGFFATDYVEINLDLRQLGDDFVAALSHFVTIGLNERSRIYGRWQFHFDDLKISLPTAAAPLLIAPSQERINVGVLIHIFYPDVWRELAAFAQNFRNRSFDIFINVVDHVWTPELHEEIRSLAPGAFVQLSNNTGHDVGGHIRLLDNIDIDRYDFFALMHTKKSPHIASERGAHWRRTMLRAFAGNPEIAEECVDLMLSDPSIGMIGAKEWRSFDMGKNYDQYERVLDLFGIEGANRDLDYLSGTMFLIRADIMKRLHDVLRAQQWESGTGKNLEFHMDGQIEHGVERAVPALARHMGYQVVYR